VEGDGVSKIFTEPHLILLIEKVRFILLEEA